MLRPKPWRRLARPAPPQQDEQRRQSQFDRHEQQEEGVRRANHQPGERAASAADKGTRTAPPRGGRAGAERQDRKGDQHRRNAQSRQQDSQERPDVG